MAKPLLCGRILLVLGILSMAGLASCAAPVPVRVQPVQSSTNTARFTIGRVVAARSVGPGENLSGSQAGFDGVMAALQEPAPALSFTAKEFIVQESDGNPVSVVTRVPNANAPGSVPAADFSVGDPVEIVAGTQTELVHRN